MLLGYSKTRKNWRDRDQRAGTLGLYPEVQSPADGVEAGGGTFKQAADKAKGDNGEATMEALKDSEKPLPES